jgi:hypothetical protein
MQHGEGVRGWGASNDYEAVWSAMSDALNGEILGPGNAPGGGRSPDVDLAVLDTPVAPPTNYKIGRKLNDALTAMVNGANTIQAAAELAGMNRCSLSLALKKPHVIARLDELVATATRTRGIKALSKLERLMEARSEYVQLEAARDLADRAGYTPPKDAPVQDTTLVVNIRLG